MYNFDDLVVLKDIKVPAVLFEAGIIANRDEELLIIGREYHRSVAKAFGNAVMRFCAHKAV